MLDILGCLDEMSELVERLLNDAPNKEQKEYLSNMQQGLSSQKALYPYLIELIADRSVWEGVRQISHEWRGPIIYILGCTQLWLEANFWPISQSQRTATERIRELANQLWEWSNQGHPPL